MRFLLVELGVLRSLFFTSLSLLCHFSHTVLLPVSFVVELLLSIFFPCHAIYHGLFFFLKSTVSDCIYWINRSFFSVSSHDAMTTSLGCSHVLFMSSLFPIVIHRICFGVTIEILSLCLSLLTFQYRIFFFWSLLKLFSVPKNLIFATTCSRWWSEDASALLFALTSYRDDLWAISMWSNWFSYLRLVLQRLVNFLQ